jgi:hypothetical protein
MLEADEHTLEDLELLAAAHQRNRLGDILLLASGAGCAFAGGDSWKRFSREIERAMRDSGG